ncbi:DNA alkylation repair protein [Candidatus Auribacterota bacterium]
MTYKEITGHLRDLADPQIAEHSQRFFKTSEGEYGFGDKFLGIRVPVIRQAVNKYKNTPLSIAERLLKSVYHEVRLFSLLLSLRLERGGQYDPQLSLVEVSPLFKYRGLGREI